jgi:hypothetical protein
MADQNTTEPQQAQIGPAESMPESVADADVPVPAELLDRRQAQMGTRRRPGGPVLEESLTESVAESLPDQPETDCAPPGADTNR